MSPPCPDGGTAPHPPLSPCADPVTELVTEAVLFVFHHYHLTVTRNLATEVQARDPRPSSCKRIDFTTPCGAGTMAILAPDVLLGKTHPWSPTPASPAELGDWLGELCNMILGRFANLCIARGLEIRMSVPRPCDAATLRDPTGTRLSFWMGEDALDVFVDLGHARPGPERAGSREPEPDGSVTLFQDLAPGGDEPP